MNDFKYRIPTLAISNEKGGVGKTFVTSSIAEWAARFLDLNVLVIDTDIQCNLTAVFVGVDFVDIDGATYRVPSVHPDYKGSTDQLKRPSISTFFDNEANTPYPTFISPESSNIIKGCVDVVAADGYEIECIVSRYAGDINDPVCDAFRTELHHDDYAAAYDLIIFDTNPNRNLFSRSTLRAATHLLIPMEFDLHCIDGIRAALASFEAENTYRAIHNLSELTLTGLLPNKYVKGSSRSQGISQNLYDNMENLFTKLFLSKHSFIPQAEVVKKVSAGYHKADSLFDITKKSKTEYRLRIALEHACMEVLRSVVDSNHWKVQNDIDRHEQRIRRIQKQLAV